MANTITNYNQLSDVEIIETIKEGDALAFDYIFNKLYPSLCAYAYQFTPDYEDAVQEVMIWLWTKREIVYIESSIKTYLCKAIKNKLLNKFQQAATRWAVHEKIYKSLENHFENPDMYDIKELSDTIERAINRLPESYKRSFVMKRFEEMSYAQIAVIEAVSVKTIEYRITQAQKILRNALKDYAPLLFFIELVR